MKTKHIQLLNDQAAHYFEQAINTPKPKDKLLFTEQARSLLSEARDVFQNSKRNSILVYFEFMLLLSKKPAYDSYLEFCVRNELDLLSEKDYLDLSRSIDPFLD